MADDLQISLVPLFAVEKEWDRVKNLLKAATDMSGGRYRISDLKNKLTTGEFQLWVIFDQKFEIVAAVTTTCTEYPDGKFLSGQFIGGTRMEDWKDKFCDVIENWSRDCKCKSVELTGRSGWSKVLAPNGYREMYRTYQKDLK